MGTRRVAEASLAALVPTQYKPGQSGNPSGKPSTKPITDAMRLLLAGDKEAFMQVPRTVRLIVGRWYGQAWEDPRGMALLLDRIEGKVGDGPERPLPNITFLEQHFGTVNVQGSPRMTRTVEATPVEANGHAG